MSIAVMTIVRNESRYLPVWLEYWSRYLPGQDIYVLDNESDDGSTDALPCLVWPARTDGCYDARGLVRAVSTAQCRLLQQYRTVVYTDVDEIICCHNRSPIDQILQTPGPVVRCNGFEVVQQLQREKMPVNWDQRPLLRQRGWWYPSKRYNKPAIARVPVSWHVGFHTCGNPDTVQSDRLVLVHLHRLDFTTVRDRNIRNVKANKINQESLKNRWGWQNWLKESDLRAKWNYVSRPAGKLQRIPRWVQEVV